MNDHMTLIDILLSRLFHDLISPVSATVNGAELIAELGGGEIGELEQDALNLIGTSAKQSSERLSFFRVAFGGAGSNADHSLADGAALAEPYLAARKIEFTLNCDGDPKAARFPKGTVKVALGLICMLSDCLPRGGEIELEVSGPDASSINITARGQGAAIDDEFTRAMQPSVDAESLGSKSVIAYVAAENARRFGVEPEISAQEGSVSIALKQLQ